MQNEMMKVMALRVLREIAASIQSTPFFTVMVDGTTEASNVEQVVVSVVSGVLMTILKLRRILWDYTKWQQLKLRPPTLLDVFM